MFDLTNWQFIQTFKDDFFNWLKIIFIIRNHDYRNKNIYYLTGL